MPRGRERDILVSVLYLRGDQTEAKLHVNAHTWHLSQTNLSDGSLSITINKSWQVGSRRRNWQKRHRGTAGLLYPALDSSRVLSSYRQEH